MFQIIVKTNHAIIGMYIPIYTLQPYKEAVIDNLKVTVTIAHAPWYKVNYAHDGILKSIKSSLFLKQLIMLKVQWKNGNELSCKWALYTV